MYCVDIYIEEVCSWMREYGFTKKENQYGIYYQASGLNSKSKKKLEKILKHKQIRHRWYDSRQERSSDYRKMFFLHNPPPYRCRYCNRKLKKNEVQVDHIIPVSRVKTSFYARDLMYQRGFDNVNDIRNLAPSCKRCNLKKGKKLGLWYIRGLLGKYRWYWMLQKLIVLFLIIFAAYCLYHFV